MNKCVLGVGAEYHKFESPTKSTVLIAMHLCPAAPNPAANNAFKVVSMFASGMTIAELLAPELD